MFLAVFACRPTIGFLERDLCLLPLLDLRLDLRFGRLEEILGRSVCGLGRSDALRLMFLAFRILQGVLSQAELESVLLAVLEIPSGNSLSSLSVANNCMSIYFTKQKSQDELEIPDEPPCYIQKSTSICFNI